MSDVNLFSIAGQRPLGYRQLGNLQAGEGMSDALKITDCADGEVCAGGITGGREDCVDVNNKCSNITIAAILFEPKGKYLATIKGGSRDITLRGRVRGHGTEVDIDIGNVSDQSDNVTGRVFLDLEHEMEDVITVRVLGGVRPVFLNSYAQRYELVFVIPGLWRSLFLKGYKLLKRLGVPI